MSGASSRWLGWTPNSEGAKSATTQLSGLTEQGASAMGGSTPSGTFGTPEPRQQLELRSLNHLSPLPAHLRRLVAAACSERGLGVAPFTGGIADLDQYVCAWAAHYACGGDTSEHLRRLEVAHQLWKPF